jgi:predicted molibdopterin-dependent oxidoreductase YjgC
MGELGNISSGKVWQSVAESDARARFELVWSEPSQQSPVVSRQYLAVARSLYDRGTLVSKTKIVQSRVPTPFVEMNSQDAEQLGIADGARVRVLFDSRVIELNARVDGGVASQDNGNATMRPNVPPGAVLMPNNLDGTTALPLGARVKIERV